MAEIEPDPATSGRNFPDQYEAYLKTVRTSALVKYSAYGRYGGSEAFSKIDKYPDLVRIFAGNPFSVEYREEQGHQSRNVAFMHIGNPRATACVRTTRPNGS